MLNQNIYDFKCLNMVALQFKPHTNMNALYYRIDIVLGPETVSLVSKCYSVICFISFIFFYIERFDI